MRGKKRSAGLDAAVREDVQGQQVLAAAERAATTKKGMAMAAAAKKEAPFDWQLVKVEESGMCDATWIKEKGIATCGFFYLVDVNRHVHICSLTPSLEMHALVPYATFHEDVSDEVREEVDEELRGSEESVTYMDVSTVMRLPRQAVRHAPERESDEDRESYYDRAVEEMREHFQGNHPWF